MKTIITDKITLPKIKRWIDECKSLYNLQSIRAKTNKRIKNIISPKEESPFKQFSIKEKYEIIKELFV